MPRTSASGVDAVVGTKVPSTTADSSKGAGTTQPQKSAPASSSTADNAGNTGSQAVIVWPTRKFGTRKLAVIRAPT